MADLTITRQEELGLDSVSAPQSAMQSTGQSEATSVSNQQVTPSSSPDRTPQVSPEVKTSEPTIAISAEAEMPRINRPRSAEPATELTQERAEHLAFQRLRRDQAVAPVTELRQTKVKAAQPQMRKLPTHAASKGKTRGLGFSGETILDKFVNALLTVVRSIANFISQRFFRSKVAPVSTVIIKPKTKSDPATSLESPSNDLVNNSLSGRPRTQKKYYPKRSL